MGKAKIVKKRNVGKSNNVEYKAVDIQRAYLGYQFGLAYMEMYGKSIFPMDEVSNNILSILKVYGDNFFIEEDGRKVILTLAESIGY